MKYFKVMLEGRNFKFRFDDSVLRADGTKRLSDEVVEGGFLTTRWVKAKDDVEAEIKAVELIKSDSSLSKLMVVDSVKPPMIYLEEMSEVSWLSYFRRKPGKGYSFYVTRK